MILLAAVLVPLLIFGLAFSLARAWLRRRAHQRELVRRSEMRRIWLDDRPDDETDPDERYV